jgi:hypothetical protein
MHRDTVSAELQATLSAASDSEMGIAKDLYSLNDFRVKGKVFRSRFKIILSKGG